MSARRFTVRKLFLAAASVPIVSAASATTYTDASNDQVTNGHNAATDIRSVAVSDAGGIVSFLVTLAPPTDLSNNGSGDYYVQYQFGIQTYSTPSGVAGASDGGLTTSPDPFTNPMFISTGMTDFIQAEFSSFPGGVYGGAGYMQGWQPSSSTMVGLP